MIKVKFEGINGNYNEENEPFTNSVGQVQAVYSFETHIPKGKIERNGKDEKVVYVNTPVSVCMETWVDPETPARDWMISATSFAELWTNANKRHERLLFENQMHNVGITFNTVGDAINALPSSLMAMHKKREFLKNEL